MSRGITSALRSEFQRGMAGRGQRCQDDDCFFSWHEFQGFFRRALIITIADLYGISVLHWNGTEVLLSVIHDFFFAYPLVRRFYLTNGFMTFDLEPWRAKLAKVLAFWIVLLQSSWRDQASAVALRHPCGIAPLPPALPKANVSTHLRGVLPTKAVSSVV